MIMKCKAHWCMMFADDVILVDNNTNVLQARTLDRNAGKIRIEHK